MTKREQDQIRKALDRAWSHAFKAQRKVSYGHPDYEALGFILARVEEATATLTNSDPEV
jgi:hypothetical protein